MKNMQYSNDNQDAPGHGQSRQPQEPPAHDGPPPYQGGNHGGAPFQPNYYAQYPYRPSYGYNQYPPQQQSFGAPPQPQYAYPPIPLSGQPPPPQYGGPPPSNLSDMKESDVKKEHYDDVGQEQRDEKDRGLLGALAGGAAGAYAGHKVNHGFIGAVGGAFAGHKIQDAVHHHHNEKPPPPVPPKPAAAPPYSQSQPYQYAPPPTQAGPILGNFTLSSAKIMLDRNLDLIAECEDIRQIPKLSSIPLNSILTNENGRFRWVNPTYETGNFGASARNVRLLDGGRTLEAELRMVNGSWRWDRVCLDERIENSDGNLRKI